MGMRQHARPLFRYCKKCLVCYLPVFAIATTAYFAFVRPKGELIIARTRPVSVKPPLIDRSRMEKLGMYDEPEPLDFEWMEPGAFRPLVAPIGQSVLSVTRLPDSGLARHNSKYISNALAGRKLCGFQDRPCRVLLPAAIGEQESKAQVHVQQIAILARSLDLTLVLPNMHKARFGACSRNKFEDYYELESLEQLGVRVTTYGAFLEWVAARRMAPKSQVVEVVAVGRGHPSDVSVVELEAASNGPPWRRCLSKSAPRLDFAKNKIHLTLNSTRSADLAAFGGQIIRTLNSTPAWDQPQVYALDWSLRHPVFEGISSRYISYSNAIISYGNALLDAAGPTVVVQWRMESVPPENLVACSSGLINLLQSTLAEEEYSDVKIVYFATDYPLEGTDTRRSGTFRDIGEHHHTAVSEFRQAFQPGELLGSYKLVSYAELSQVVPHNLVSLEGDPGFLGIMDKVIAQKAELLVSGFGSECGRNSSFTKQIINARRGSLEHENKVRNDVLFFGRAM